MKTFNYQKHSAEAVQQILKSCPSQGDDILATCSKGPSYRGGRSAAPRGALDTQPDPVANNAASAHLMQLNECAVIYEPQ